jgi:predicted RNase H-like HicB family nuclease
MVSGTTSYYFTPTSGLCSNIYILNVTVNPNPIANISVAGSAVICEGASVLLTATGGVDYLWDSGLINNEATIEVTSAGNYTVTVTDINGCSSTADQNIIVNPNPLPVISAMGSTVVCDGESVLLNTDNFESYLWNDAAASTTPSISVNTSGNYHVTVTNIYGCSATSENISVLIKPVSESLDAYVSQQTDCSHSTGTIQVTAPLGSGYEYSIDGGAHYSTSTTFDNLIPGDYSVLVRNDAVCIPVNNMNLTIEPQTSLPNDLLITGPIDVCNYIGSGDTICFTVSTSSVNTYFTWVYPIVGINVVSITPSILGNSSTICLKVLDGFETQSNHSLLVVANNLCGISTTSVVLNTNCNTITNQHSNNVIKTVKSGQGSDELELMIYPNPSTNEFNIRLKTINKEEVSIKLMDATGRYLKTINMMPTDLMKMGNDLKPGAYFIEATQSGVKKSQRIIKF